MSALKDSSFEVFFRGYPSLQSVLLPMRRVLAKPPFKLTIPSSFDSDPTQCSKHDVIAAANKSYRAGIDIDRANNVAASLPSKKTVKHYSFKFAPKVATARLARGIHSTTFYIVSLFIVDSQIDDDALKMIFPGTRHACV